MKQHKFKSHEEYIAAQERITRHKTKIKRDRGFTSEKVVQNIVKLFDFNVKNGLCHGVRRGQELDLFESYFGGSWIGTEIVAELCDGKRIIHADFMDLPKDWIGRFDIVYSNSLDHARDPFKTAKTWIASLAPNGRLFVEWTVWHNKLGKKWNKADCWAASESEYLKLLDSAGTVDDVIRVPDRATKDNRKFERVIFSVY